MVAAAGCGKKTQVTLGEYKGIALTRISEATLEQQIQTTLENYAELTEVDRPAEEGDTVNINYTGTQDGVAFEGGTDDSEEGTDLELGSGSFIPGFEDGLIGTSAGDTVDLNLTFPETYSNNPDMAGQAVVFHVTVNAVKASVVPELTDEFVQENSDYESVEEYRTSLREAMNEQTFYEQIMESLLASSEVENYPEDRITEEKESFVNYYTMYAQYYGSMLGVDTETALQYFGIESMQALEETGEQYAYNVVKQQLILEKIAENEKISVSEERYNTEVAVYAEEYGYDTVEEFLENYTEEDVRSAILMDMVMEFCIENAIISDAE
ncbi:MAG: trigger factor [Lachnospiraceae bacterium]